MTVGGAAAAGIRAPPTSSLVGSLARAATTTDRGLHFVDRRERLHFVPWAAVAAAADTVGGQLAAMGVQRGDRVALVFPTCEEFFAAFFGVMVAGAVPVPMYPPVRLGRLDDYHRSAARMLRAVDAVLVLADPLVRRLLGESIATAQPRLGCLTVTELAARSGDGRAALAGDADATAARLDQAAATIQPEALGLVQFSSGTTVDPKPVALSHRALLAQTRILGSLWPDRPDHRPSCLSWLPLYHDMGLIGCVFPALDRPADLTLIGPELFVARPAIWLQTLSRTRATVSPAPNFAYGLCVAKIRDEELAGVDLGGWHAALNGAEAVAPAVLRAFADRFARWGFSRTALTPVYGLSEAALAVTFSALDRPFRVTRFDRQMLGPGDFVHPLGDLDSLEAPPTESEKPPPELPALDVEGFELASVGRPLPGFELAIRGADHRELASGQIGRVWVRGPSLMSGYLGQPEATACSLVDGWLDTGDLGFLHEGELFLTGRAKDLLILRGRNHAPEAVEQVISAVPGVRTGCVAAVSHLPPGGLGEELVVLVESPRLLANADRARLATRVREAVLESCGLAADRVEVLAPGTLARTSSGKIRRQETLRQLLAGTLSAPLSMGPLRLLGALTRSQRALRRARRATAEHVGRAVDPTS